MGQICRKKRLAYFDDAEGIPLNFGRGGMKVLVEKHQGKAKVEVMLEGPNDECEHSKCKFFCWSIFSH